MKVGNKELKKLSPGTEHPEKKKNRTCHTSSPTHNLQDLQRTFFEILSYTDKTFNV
jgi:hypothetical protein